jgi:DNA-binding XRE family transcriptional regulator
MSDLCEVWKPVPNYESFYAISNYGNFARIKKDGKYLRKLNSATPYLSVSLKDIDETGQKTIYIHKLVAQLFIGERPDGFVIRHLDGNKYNNHASNLAYGTPKQNYEDVKKHKIHAGENNSKALLNDKSVRAIRILNSEFQLTKHQIAKAFDVSQATIHAIIVGRNWKDVV